LCCIITTAPLTRWMLLCCLSAVCYIVVVLLIYPPAVQKVFCGRKAHYIVRLLIVSNIPILTQRTSLGSSYCHTTLSNQEHWKVVVKDIYQYLTQKKILWGLISSYVPTGGHRQKIIRNGISQPINVELCWWWRRRAENPIVTNEMEDNQHVPKQFLSISLRVE